jgi:hypothetical protein
LRGAGWGTFGVATTLVFRTLPMPSATRFDLVWPYPHAAAVVEAWQGWSPSGPDELAASLLIVALGDPDLPPVARVFGAMLGSESETATLLEELVARVGADPASEVLEHGSSYRETKRRLAEAGAEGGPHEEGSEGVAFSKSEFFRRPPPAEAIAASSITLPREGLPARPASWTSRRGAGPTTACRPTRLPSPIGTSGSC